MNEIWLRWSPRLGIMAVGVKVLQVDRGQRSDLGHKKINYNYA